MTTLRYDEPVLLDRLAGASARARALFAAMNAERLFGFYEMFARNTGQGDTDSLRAALDAAWQAIDGDGPTAELERERDVAEGLVPEEDENWVIESGFASDAAAAVAYALRARLADNPQEAAYTARSLYDASDFVAQQQLGDLDLNEPGAEDKLADQPVVQEALAGIQADLAAALSDPPPADIPRLRDEARQGAAALVELVRP